MGKGGRRKPPSQTYMAHTSKPIQHTITHTYIIILMLSIESSSELGIVIPQFLVNTPVIGS